MPYKIQKEQIDQLLLELAREFRKQNGKSRDVEMIIVGGGSILKMNRANGRDRPPQSR